MAKTSQDITTHSSQPLSASVLLHHLKTLAEPMREWKSNKRIPPVLLLTGQTGIGKKSIAYFLARWILCENREVTGEPDTSPCEKCPTCQRSRLGHEVNLQEITPDPSEESSSHSSPLKIEVFRKLKASAGFSALEGRSRVILIPHAERMTPQAANSMLKLLEEPPVGWVFLMTTNDPTVLLPTLISRCQVVRLKPFSTQQIEELLAEHSVEPKRRKIGASISQGSIGRALRFL